MAKFDIAIPHTLVWEGGYVFHPADPGGETNRGITDRLDGKVDGMVDLDGDGDGDVDIKGLTEDEAKQVYKRRFWDKMQGDKIHSQQIANILFDGYVNCGANGIKILQRVLNVKDDGVLGSKTLEILNSSDELIVYNKYKEARIKYYQDLAERKPQLKVFLKGWLNRINSFADLQ
jgi:lysozyme family protein